MTNFEARVYVEYIKVLLAIKGLNEDILDKALDRAVEVLGEKESEGDCQ